MKNLQQKLYFSNNQKETSIREIEKLSKDMLGITWSVKENISGKPKLINLKNKGWKFEFSNTKSFAGYCHYYKKIISISKFLLEKNLDQPQQWEETLRHEFAHAIDCVLRGTSNHDRFWKNICYQILSNGERCYKRSVIKSEHKYKGVCPNCGYESLRHRRANVACSHCCNKYNNGEYTSKYKLNYQLNK